MQQKLTDAAEWAKGKMHLCYEGMMKGFHDHYAEGLVAKATKSAFEAGKGASALPSPMRSKIRSALPLKVVVVVVVVVPPPLPPAAPAPAPAPADATSLPGRMTFFTR